MLSSHIEWPDDPDPHDSDESPFAHRPPLRKLRVMIDGDLHRVPSELLRVTPEEVLTGLLLHDHVICFRYADNGPPAGTTRYELVEGGFAYEGWVTVDPPNGHPDSRGIVFCADKRPVRGTAYMDKHRRARDEAVAYTDLPPQAAADKREADALALQVALGMDADIFVTERPYLFLSRGRSSRTKVLRSSEALAVVGLYLRSQGVYSVIRNHEAHFPMRRGGYFSVGAMELLPAVWRWSAACHQESEATGDQTLAELAGSLIQRVARALECRDELHGIINREKNNDTRSAVLSSLDTAVVLLSAAVEVSARVAHRVLDLGDRYPAGWDRPDWVKKLRERDKNLAALAGERTPGSYLMRGVAALRTSLHADTLRGLLTADAAPPTSIMFTVPPSRKVELAAMFTCFGGENAWGVRETHTGERYADPGLFVDQLFTRMLGFLNVVLARTPVERLPHVRGPLPDSPESAGQELNRYSETSRKSIRWQLGL